MFLLRGFKLLNFSDKVLIKVGSFMRVSTVQEQNVCLVVQPGVGPSGMLAIYIAESISERYS